MYGEKECQVTQEEQRLTLMQVLDRLNEKCGQLEEVAGMTERLNEKLNRTEGDPKPEESQTKQKVTQRNIAELFDMVCERMDEQIQVIDNNTDRSIRMIE
jgi:hypothetical protein